MRQEGRNNQRGSGGRAILVAIQKKKKTATDSSYCSSRARRLARPRDDRGGVRRALLDGTPAICHLSSQSVSRRRRPRPARSPIAQRHGARAAARAWWWGSPSRGRGRRLAPSPPPGPSSGDSAAAASLASGSADRSSGSGPLKHDRDSGQAQPRAAGCSPAAGQQLQQRRRGRAAPCSRARQARRAAAGRRGPEPGRPSGCGCSRPARAWSAGRHVPARFRRRPQLAGREDAPRTDLGELHARVGRRGAGLRRDRVALRGLRPRRRRAE